MKTFYIETFGCQMNVHDSEKVIGTLTGQGYSQVERPEDAELVLYNTCSIRDKAEQKVFSRLQQFKRDAGKGKVFGVLGCVAQQEGERIFDRAPHVSLVCGSASYNKLPDLLVQIKSGEQRVTGLSLDTDETFETPSSVVSYGRRGAQSIVLKVVKQRGDEWWSGDVVRAFDGRGTVRAYAHEGGALLLERAVEQAEAANDEQSLEALVAPLLVDPMLDGEDLG